MYYGFSRKTYFVGGVDSLPDIRFSKNLPASKGSHEILMAWKSALSLKKYIHILRTIIHFTIIHVLLKSKQFNVRYDDRILLHGSIHVTFIIQ